MQRSLLVDLLAARGARLSERPEAPGLPAVLTLGDVPGEYRAGTQGTLLLDATDRGALLVRGGDAAVFLHRLLANEVRGQEPDTLRPNLLLSPKGKVRFAFELERRADEMLLSTPPGTAAALSAALDAYLFSEDVRLEEATEGHAPLELVGPSAHETVRRVLGSLPALALGSTARAPFAGAEVRVWAAPVAGSAGLVLDAGPGNALVLFEALVAAGARPGGLAARDSLRVEAGAALFGVDVGEDVYPQEARLERAFSLSKGCYVGQEVVAKIDTYGGLNKRLVALRAGHDEPLPRGSRLLRDEEGEARDLGVLTSWAYSFALDAGLALGYVKRRHQGVGTEFRVQAQDGEALGTARIVPLPARPGALAPSGDFE
jgi:aminomethyltransferase